jgi:GNAT superfamily N-acetyltransferase
MRYAVVVGKERVRALFQAFNEADGMADNIFSSAATCAVAAYDGERLVGMFAFYSHERNLGALGTLVLRKYRGRGVAAKMWKAALARFRTTRVSVYVVSMRGFGLIEKLRREHPRVEFKVSVGVGVKGAHTRYKRLKGMAA